MKKIPLLLSALGLSFALNAQVTVSNIAANPNGTLSNTTDDYIQFGLMVTPGGNGDTYIAPFTYNVTATQNGNPVAVFLSDGTAVTSVLYNKYAPQSFRLANGSAGKGNVTLTVTSNVPAWATPQTAGITDPGTVSIFSPCGVGTRTKSFSYTSPVGLTEAIDWSSQIPKFDESGGRVLTQVKVTFTSTEYGRTIVENKSGTSQNVKIKIEVDKMLNLGGNTISTSSGQLLNTLVTTVPAGVTVPASGSWLGDIQNGNTYSTMQRMQTDGWLAPAMLAGLNIKNDPKYVNNAVGSVKDGDILYFDNLSVTSTDVQTFTSGATFDAFKGTGNVPLTYSTVTSTSLAGGGGNVDNYSSANTQFSVTVEYQFTEAPCYEVSGTVFHDFDGSANGIKNLSGVNTNLGLNAVLVDANGIVVDVVAVNPANGTFILGGAKGGSNYKVIITTNPATKGAAAPAVALPSNWVSTGEQNGGGTVNDGTANGQSASFTMPSANVDKRDFGIEQLPDTQDRTTTIGQPSSSTITAGTITSNANSAVKGSDPEDGALGNSQTIVIKSLANNGVAYYDGTAITVGQVITGFDPTKLSYTGLANGTTSTTFDYAFKDAAGMEDPTPAHYTVSWPNALPVVFGEVNASFSDNQLLINFVSEKEVNNSHFDIEASTDGINFKTIGTVASKAQDGNSNSAISYEFTTNGSNLMGSNIGWIGAALGLALLLIAINRRNKLVRIFTLVAVMSLMGVTSCSKNGSDVNLTNEGKLWVRIVQVDKDGAKKYSKVITVVNKK